MGDIGRAGVEKDHVHIKKSKVAGTEKTRAVQAVAGQVGKGQIMWVLEATVESLCLVLRTVGNHLKV